MVDSKRPTYLPQNTEDIVIWSTISAQSNFRLFPCGKMQLRSILLASLVASASAFSVTVPAAVKQQSTSRPTALSPLFMGRAAAVRAATKGKTDARKAKTNALYGKRIIMAVKQGGSPEPSANKQLADVIKAAKANNVPVDVSRYGTCVMTCRTL